MRAQHVIAGLALATALTSCSSSDGDKKAEAPAKEATSAVPASSEPPAEADALSAAAEPEDELETAYRTYVDAFLTGDGATAYGLLSERCQGEMPLSEFAATVEAAGEAYGQMDYTIESIDIDGDKAKVNATYPVEALNQGGGSEWALQDGQWRMDRC